jgi:hypothetical protein
VDVDPVGGGHDFGHVRQLAMQGVNARLKFRGIGGPALDLGGALLFHQLDQLELDPAHRVPVQALV